MAAEIGKKGIRKINHERIDMFSFTRTQGFFLLQENFKIKLFEQFSFRKLLVKSCRNCRTV